METLGRGEEGAEERVKVSKVHLSVCLSVCLSVGLSVFNNLTKFFFLASDLDGLDDDLERPWILMDNVMDNDSERPWTRHNKNISSHIIVQLYVIS